MSAANPSRQTDPCFLEDLKLGQRFISGSQKISEQKIIDFALEFDPQPFHTDPAAATATLFQGLVASGWHTASVSMRLLLESGLAIAGGVVGAGVEISWPQPTRPGDSLHVECEVIDVRTSKSRSDRGVVTVRSETRNQDNQIVQVLVAKLIVPRRP